ncbi:MAG: ABC transporter ATP-binding protein [Burkholderiales bacterium]
MLNVATLTAGYGDLTVLRDVELEVRQGEFVALVGSNAAGKSTLLRAIFGLLPLQAGRVGFEGKQLDGRSPYAIAQLGLSLVLEQSVLRGMSTYDNLLLGAYRREARASINQTLESVFALFPVLAERRGQLASSLSGGEQQMLCIGRALMGKPKLLILDEPSVGLSPVMVAVILKALAKLNRDGLTILLAEQNVAQTLKVAGRAYVLESGRIVLQGAALELLDNPSVKRAYLGI